MRELTFATLAVDVCLLPDLILGMPKLGWAAHAPGQRPRDNPPEVSLESLMTNRAEHNEFVFRTLKGIGDAELDTRSWTKSKEEFESGALIGPFSSLSSCSLPVRLVPRFPIWEQHGGGEVKVRNIDNMLEGGQNAAAGTQYTHVPATLDDLAAIVRAWGDLLPDAPLAGFPSDFAAAYRQVTADPEQAHLCAVATWNTEEQHVVFGLAVAQLFGGKSAGLNFARVPAWCCRVLAYLFAAPFVHCVDDMLCIEPDSRAYSAFQSWRELARLCGWDIPDRKSPPPSPSFVALGGLIDLAPLPDADALIKITQLRAKNLRNELKEIAKTKVLAPGAAARLVGRLGFACTLLFGRLGRAKLRPFIRRCAEHGRSGVNAQMTSAITWWLQELRFARSRPIPRRLMTYRRALS